MEKGSDSPRHQDFRAKNALLEGSLHRKLTSLGVSFTLRIPGMPGLVRDEALLALSKT